LDRAREIAFQRDGWFVLIIPAWTACLLLPQNDMVSPQTAGGHGDINPYSLAMPNNTALMECELTAQGAPDHITAPNFSGFAALGFALIFTNAIRFKLGLDAPSCRPRTT
jgi:hypothetical protein